MPKVISQKEFNILSRTKERVNFQIVYTKQRNGLHKLPKSTFLKTKTLQ